MQKDETILDLIDIAHEIEKKPELEHNPFSVLPEQAIVNALEILEDFYGDEL